MSLWVSDNFGANQANSLISRYRLVVKDKEKYNSLKGKLPNFDFRSFSEHGGSENAELLKLFGFDGEEASSEIERIYSAFYSLIDANLDRNTFRYVVEKM